MGSHVVEMNRVLLTRGREGFIIYVPHDTTLNDVYDNLINLGVISI